MSILLRGSSRVLVQGFTGKEGTFHAEQMISYGTRVVGGVTPGKGGTRHLGLGVFNTVADVVKEMAVDVSIIFVPPAFASDAILEAVDSNIGLIVAITEGIPIHEMVRVRHYMRGCSSRLIGPNCPGIITPGEAKVGIMPDFIHRRGGVGVVSRSGTLTYEAVDQITKLHMGQSTCIGIGGDPIIGTTMKDAVALFMDDADTEAIVMIGEIGGTMEVEAASYVRDYGTKPVIGFVAGQTAPAGRRMGHAGAIIGGAWDRADAKMRVMKECGVHVVISPADIGQTVHKILVGEGKEG